MKKSIPDFAGCILTYFTFEVKSTFFFKLNTRLISSLEVRELVSQVDNPLAGEQVQYFVLFRYLSCLFKPAVVSSGYSAANSVAVVCNGTESTWKQ
jgi:hypothetical protein